MNRDEAELHRMLMKGDGFKPENGGAWTSHREKEEAVTSFIDRLNAVLDELFEPRPSPQNSDG